MSKAAETGAFVVRLTMNARLRRAAFGLSTVYLVWCLAAIFGAVLLATSQSHSVRILGACALIVAWCGWTGWTTIRDVRRRHRVLSLGVPTLELDGLGLRVRDVPMHLDGAALAWADCAAVVLSASPRGRDWPVQPQRYIQFVPVSEDRVSSSGRPPRADDGRVVLLGLSKVAASLTWLELPGVRPDADDVVAWLRVHRPTMRLIGARHSVTDE